jgi:hypothetical protein
MGFFPSKAEPDIWIWAAGDHCECIACYMDDLLIASKKLQAIVAALEVRPHQFLLKGTGPVKFHLGFDNFHDEDGNLCVGPRTYIKRLADQHKVLFSEAPKLAVTSPIDLPLVGRDCGFSMSITDRCPAVDHHPRAIRHCSGCDDPFSLPHLTSRRTPLTSQTNGGLPPQDETWLHPCSHW